MLKSIVLHFSCLIFAASVSFAEEISPGVMRTPDERFENFADYPFEPNYMAIKGLRIHYLDEGPKDGKPVFLLHGEPTWSYLFRKMIPVLTGAGHRVIVPDMVGFGKSDKFISKHDYSYVHHIDVMKELVERLDLTEATFFGQDWGGMVGLRVVAEMPDRFAKVVVSNTGMAARGGISGWLFENFVKLMVWWNGPVTFDELKTAADKALLIEDPSALEGARMFSKWIAHSYYSDDMDVAAIISTFGRLDLSEEEIRAYEAPYPTGEYKAGAHVFPYLIPTQLAENEEYWVEVFEKWDKPFLVAFGGDERITARMKDDFMTRIPNPTEITLEGVGHFCQEEVGPQLAEVMNDLIAGRPVEGFSKID
jgi:haloalkane dehalogenase